jgi:dolichol-phosphate mannosyltransferase
MSIVSPVYLADTIIEHLIEQILKNVKVITDNFEIILVDDCSPDNSWKKIKDLCSNNSKIKAVKLSKNFGQHAAILAGISMSKGEWVVIMDCDLQDNPEEIINLHSKAIEGFDAVLAARENRQHSFFKKTSSLLFYKVLSWLSGTYYDGRVANFGIYNKKVINTISKMKESNPYFTAMVNWVGFNKTILPVLHSARLNGKSAYSFKKLLKLAANAILAYSDKPLKLIIYLGLIISFTSFILGLNIILKYLNGDISILGYTSISTLICFFGGLNIIVLGVIGLYIGKVFEGIKNRPSFVINELVNV